jgi:hypothetical protein
MPYPNSETLFIEGGLTLLGETLGVKMGVLSGQLENSYGL